MDVEVTQTGGVAVLRLAGAIADRSTVDVLKKTLQALILEEKYDLILDVTELTTLDSLGIGIIISHYVSAEAHDGRVLLLGANPRIRELMEHVQLEDRFGWASSLDEALEYFTPA